MATGVLSTLRDTLRAERLDVLAAPWAAAVFARHPAVDTVLEFATPWWIAARGGPRRERIVSWLNLVQIIRTIRAADYDIGVDLRGDLRQILCFLVLGRVPARVSSNRTGGAFLLTHVWDYDPSLHEVERSAAIASTLGVRVQPRLDVTMGEGLPAEIARQLDEWPSGFLALSLHGRVPKKGWPRDHAVSLVEAAFHELGLPSVYIGGPEERLFADALRLQSRTPLLNAAGSTSLAQSFTILRRAQAGVMVDSGPMHLAAAANLPLVALFGPEDPKQFRPWTDRAVVLESGAPCGCLHRTCDHAPPGPGACMRRVAPERVLGALRDILQTRAPSANAGRS
jgi:ADP-heptose:LPS heptosyltransferase